MSKLYTIQEFFNISRDIRMDRIERGMEHEERLDRYRHLSTYAMRLIQAEASAASQAAESSYARTEFSMAMDPGFVLRITREVLDIWDYLFSIDQLPASAERFATARKPVPTVNEQPVIKTKLLPFEPVSDEVAQALNPQLAEPPFDPRSVL